MRIEKDIPWKRLAAEAVAIVGSILLAFAIDAWWDERTDRVRLVGAIQNLASEVSEARAEIEGATKGNQVRIDALRGILSRSPENLMELDDELIMSLSNGFQPPLPFDTSGFALQGLLAGGNFEIISDKELGAALIAWSQFPAEIERDYAEALEIYMMRSEKIAPHDIFAAFRSEYFKDPPIPGVITSREALAAIRSDREIVNLTSLLIFHFEDFNSQLADGIELADRVLEASRRYVQ